MAEDNTVESPSVDGGGGDQSLEDLRQTYASKQEELAGLRAEREQAQRDAVEKVQRAQLVQAIERVDAEIEAEQLQLDIQRGIDPKLVGTGVPTESVEPPPPLVETKDNGEPVLQTLEYGAVAQPVQPVDTTSSETETDEPSEGDEN